MECQRGPAWYFDLDYLTDSMDYSRVRSTNPSAGPSNATTNNAGSQDTNDSDTDDDQDVIILPSYPSNATSSPSQMAPQDSSSLRIENLDNLLKLKKISVFSAGKVFQTPSTNASLPSALGYSSSLFATFAHMIWLRGYSVLLVIRQNRVTTSLPNGEKSALGRATLTEQRANHHTHTFMRVFFACFRLLKLNQEKVLPQALEERHGDGGSYVKKKSSNIASVQQWEIVDSKHPNKVNKVSTALYGLRSSPRAWYVKQLYSTFLVEESGYRRAPKTKHLFINKDSKISILVQVYLIGDASIILVSTQDTWCDECYLKIYAEFEFDNKFSMGELTFSWVYSRCKTKQYASYYVATSLLYDELQYLAVYIAVVQAHLASNKCTPGVRVPTGSSTFSAGSKQVPPVSTSVDKGKAQLSWRDNKKNSWSKMNSLACHRSRDFDILSIINRPQEVQAAARHYDTDNDWITIMAKIQANEELSRTLIVFYNKGWTMNLCEVTQCNSQESLNQAPEGIFQPVTPTRFHKRHPKRQVGIRTLLQRDDLSRLRLRLPLALMEETMCTTSNFFVCDSKLRGVMVLITSNESKELWKKKVESLRRTSRKRKFCCYERTSIFLNLL
ncbi:hypothetical protein Tco_0079043 [Tanacetum coccineum]